MKANLLTALFALAFGFLLLLLVDRVAGLLLPRSYDLVVPSYSRARYVTPEFSFSATVNHQGFRGRPVSLGEKRGYRVVLLGDSYTFGWGVAEERTWPTLLEAELRRDCRNVEVANLGRIGGSPAEYASVAERAVPLLEPDLVVVAVLQADDLAQTVEHLAVRAQPEAANDAGSERSAERLLSRLFPHLRQLATRWRGEWEIDISRAWRAQVSELLAGLSPAELRRLEGVDRRVVELLEGGQLSPAVVLEGLRYPDRFANALRHDEGVYAEAVALVGAHLRRVREVAERAGADAFVFSVPCGAFVSESSLTGYRDMGFAVGPDFLTTTAMDEATRAAARDAGLDFLEATRTFREAARTSELFFPLDGHLNEQGSSLLSRVMYPAVRERMMRFFESPETELPCEVPGGSD